MIRHFCLDIEGGIANAKDLKGCINVDGRTLETVAEVRKFLRSQLAMGRKFLPCGRCSNFDYQTGCKGHEHPEEWLKLKSIGLRNPTEVENDEGKTLMTVGLDPIGLVQKWKEHFGFREDTTIWLEADENLIQSCRKKTEIKGLKTIEEILNEQRVYFWEENE